MKPRMYRDPENTREDYLIETLEDYNAYYLIRGRIYDRHSMLFSKIQEPLIVLKSDFQNWLELS